jgi:chitodextrinase
VLLSWNAASDDVGVAGYTITRDGASLASVPGTSLVYTDTTATQGNTYSYAVDAFDGAGNHSALSAPAAVTLPDTIAPSTPTGLSASVASYAEANLTWNAAGDNVGVAGYTVYRGGVALASIPGTSLAYSDTSVQLSTTYSYTVDAFDQAGNHSAISTVASITMPDPPTGLMFGPAADTYVSSGSPTTNYGTRTTVRLDASPDMHGYMRFNVQNLYGQAITQARLLVYTQNKNSQGFRVHAVAENTWDELTMNYNNAPALGGVLASSGAVSTGNWVSLDVTPYVTGEGTYSFGVSTGSASAFSLASRESGANAPQLILSLQSSEPDVQAPSIPSEVTAAASSATQVDLGWMASSDTYGVTGYTIYRNGSTLAMVSGMSLSFTDKTVFPATTYIYTVDAFDAAGNHSAASAQAEVTTLNMPPSLTFVPSADSYVSSTKPNSNYGTLTSLRLDASPILRSYLRFDVLGLGGMQVAQAQLRVYVGSATSQGFSVLSVADNTWNELGLTYNNAPTLGSLLAASGPVSASGWVTLDVTPYVTADGSFSFGITTTSSSLINLSSREAGATSPQLIVVLE